MNKIAACLIVLGFLAGGAPAAVAQTNSLAGASDNTPESAQTNAPGDAVETRNLSLQDCITEAIKHNFDVRVERYEPFKSQLLLSSAYAGYDPNFALSGVHSHNNAGGFVGTNGLAIKDANSYKSSLGGLLPSGGSYSLGGNVGDNYFPYPENAGGQVGISATQPLLKNLWIDSTRLAISSAKNGVKQSEQALRQQLIITVSAVENAFYELIFAREDLIVHQEALDLAQTQLDQDRQRVQFGSLSPLDVQQDEAQVAQSRANLIGTQFTLESDQNALKNLITDDYLKWHDFDITPNATLDAVRQWFDVQDSWNKGLTSRPDLLQAKITLAQEGIQLKYDRNQILPEIDLVGSYGFNGAGVGYNDTFGQYQAGNRPFYTYGAQLSVPLSNLGARDAYKADKATQQQDLLRVKALEQNVMVQIDDAVKQARSAWESVGATKEARVYAEAALDAEQKKYSVGKSTTFTVLQLQNSLTTARSQEIQALVKYQEALTNLAQQEGSTLARRNVDVTLK